MALPTVAVAIATSILLGGPLPLGRVEFELTRADVAGAIVVPQKQTVYLAADGTASVALWPTALGTQSSQYRVCVYSQEGQLQASGFATVPNAPCNLHDVLTLTPAALDSTTTSAIAAQAAVVNARSYANLVLVGL